MATAEKIQFATPTVSSPLLVLTKGGEKDVTRSSTSSSPKTGKKALNRASPRLQEETPKAISSFAAIVLLMQAIVALTSSRANNDAQTAQAQTQVSSTMNTATQQATQQTLDQLQNMEQAQQAANQVSFYQKLAGWALTAVAIVVTAAIMGPVAAAMIGTVMIIDQTGVLNNALQGIHSPAVRFAVKLAIVVGVSIAAGGGGALLESAGAAMIRSAATTGTDAAAGAAAGAARGALEDTASTAAQSTVKQGIAVGAQVALQETVSLNPFQDMWMSLLNPNDSDDPGKQKAVMIATVITQILLMAGSMAALRFTPSSSSAILDGIEAGAKSGSTGLQYAQNTVNFLRNPWLTYGVSTAGQGLSAIWDIRGGMVSLDQAAIIKALGQPKAELTVLNAISAQLQSWMQQFQADAQARSSELASDVNLWDSYAQPWQDAARAVAGRV